MPISAHGLSSQVVKATAKAKGQSREGDGQSEGLTAQRRTAVTI
jgi:hypothetical protein